MNRTSMLQLGFSVVTFITLMVSICTSVNAALQPFSFLGTVMAKNGENGLITIQTEYQHSWSGWTPHSELIEGNARAASLEQEKPFA